jgi:predicted transcriptional regulator
MRTTLTIDDDIAQALKDLSRESGTSFKAVVNEMLRRGLTTSEKPIADREPFKVASARRGFRAGIDLLKLNQLADELETERFLVRNQADTQRS